MPEITHQSLGLPGFWRLAWFGKLDRVPSVQSLPRIKTYLRPLPHWPRSRTVIDVQTPPMIREVNIGDLALLHLNAVIGDGKILPINPNPWASRTQITLDVTRANLTVFRRFDKDADDQYIVPIRGAQLEDDPDANALFMGIGDGKDRYAYIVPCVENFRFFYSTSSALTKSMLAGDFLEPDRHLWDVNESWIDPRERIAFIRLRKRMLDADARFLARFAFNGYALMQAREVFLYAAGRIHEGGERTIRALPPFEGETRFTANVIDFESAGQQRKLITQFISCHWKPPFDRVEFLRENDGRYDARRREDRNQSNWNQRPVSTPGKPPEDINLSEGPANSDLAPWELDDSRIDERFPELAKISAIKREREEATTKGGRPKFSPGSKSTKDGTTGERKTCADLVKEVLISGLGLVVPEKEEIATDVNPHAVEMTCLLTLSLLKRIREAHKARVEFVRATTEVIYIDNVVFNVFPDDLGLKKRAWLYLPPSRTCRRCALIAALEVKGGVRYVIDIQHKRKNECSMLVLWGEAELGPGFLRQALQACQKGQGATLESLAYLPIRWNRLKHLARQDGEDEAESLLRRIFSAKPIRSSDSIGKSDTVDS